MIKGGVWKNTEDEILKAAVMKYGKNQWSRVASLLNRKSAKQCKARWYEWLDPSIKKTEWTREEEEKLLHLAKIYPSQWRTIAPIVGRTAAQCMEHYEYLLDAAQAAAGEEGLGGADDARKLRPGEIDPHPETKPARPDPVDMDEDEKEMLAEARARLANTRGKKAKRKAREKQLEEAKRLANLQKRRELKAAGVEKKAGRAKRKYVDYRTEIPFQRSVPAGFYAVGDEKQQTRQLSVEAAGRDFEVQRLDQMEGKRREKEEAEQQRKDKKKMRKIEESNPAAVMAMLSKENDPMSYRARTDLSLPAPQVTDAELDAVLKVGASALVATSTDPGIAGGATQGLVGDYASQRLASLPTPQRTPRAAGPGGDVVSQEARNQLLMLQTQTPLLGGQNPELEEGTGFGGVTPRASVAPTPKALVGTGAGGATPLAAGAGGLTPMAGKPGGATPLRDGLGVNAAPGDGALSARQEAARARHHKLSLAAALAGLPEPQFTYEIEVPEVAGEKEDKSTSGGTQGTAAEVEDAYDVAQRDAKVRAELEAERLAKRNAAVRRGLPRPTALADEPELLKVLLASGGGEKAGKDAQAEAEELVRREMAKLLAFDARAHPFAGGGAAGKQGDKKDKKRRRGAAPSLAEVPAEALAAARALVAQELGQDAEAKALAESCSDGVVGGESSSELGALWVETWEGLAWLPERSCFGLVGSASSKERFGSSAHEFEALRGHMARHAEKCAKLKDKPARNNKGYEEKGASLRRETQAAHSVLDKRTIEGLCFESLAQTEAKALPQRTAELYDLSKVEASRNADLQREYSALVAERDALFAKLANHAQ
eukprot:CAMPEP_0172647824 /NCGR_PEP_ID=MMETSP1068-20121228/240945_1 /TAXON_ID=35684 /ORGANISM="Pseudopedinella elastica, Strain CCMP716" /LENGTH=828 /DNA_ID=CAMNT_0013462113 /DNA_START=53 /DNA_END=2539 /DNA_ORIENTATION=-